MILQRQNSSFCLVNDTTINVVVAVRFVLDTAERRYYIAKCDRGSNGDNSMSERMDLFRVIADILTQYQFGTELCMSPGKFEAEPLHTIFYYNAACMGDAVTVDADGVTYSVMDVSDVERGVFGIPADKAFVAVWESETGFATSAYLSEAEYAALLRDEACETEE